MARRTPSGRLELLNAAWEPESRIDFGESCAQVLREIESRGGRAVLRKTVDVDGYFFLLDLEKAPRVFRDSLMVLFAPRGGNGGETQGGDQVCAAIALL